MINDGYIPDMREENIYTFIKKFSADFNKSKTDIFSKLEAENLDLRKNKIAEILKTYTFDIYDNTTIQ